MHLLCCPWTRITSFVLPLDDVKSWDVHKIHSLFSEPVVESILRTPLFEEVHEDKLIWNLEKHGNYTVKSGYKHYIKKKSVVQSYTVEGEWSSLWRICAPPKTKHTLWRVYRGCLPTRVRLKERGVSCPSECPICLNEDEDDWHAFFGCSVNRQVWNEAGLQAVIEPRLRQLNDVKSVLFEICINESKEVAGSVAMTLWCLWQNRNNCVWNGVKDSAKEVAIKSLHLLEEWCAVNKLQDHNSQTIGALSQSRQTVAAENQFSEISRATEQLRWQKPHEHWLKCNVDASLSPNSSYTGWGWCVRNSEGNFVAAGTNNCLHKLTIEEGEAMAILEAMREAISQGWPNIIFESDSKVVVDAIKAPPQGISELNSIITNIKLLLQCNSNFEIKFTKRQANMAAYTLARAAISWSSRSYFNNLSSDSSPTLLATITTVSKTSLEPRNHLQNRHLLTTILTNPPSFIESSIVKL
ncbi:hypothetical protein TSUD_414260 [Trifolium subterraneum]|uniref:RNase H type-1 domain-containing protein n=1 Tax=Trifolium subterraneum TaxID=3900 RepID=A0A2Z6PW38_TRISU|nr:hypothetical protein TSUD_414260 [Trifolium subterraneum]